MPLIPLSRVRDRYDLIVLGAGAGGMTAAAVAAAKGLSVLLVEKTSMVGGTTAVSGGMVWVPANPRIAEAGVEDSPARAEAYLDAVVQGDRNRELRRAFVARGSEAVRFLEEHTALHFKPVTFYPDYFPEQEGATLGGRVLEPEPFDGALLGANFRYLRPPLPEFMLFGGMMVSRSDIPHFRRCYRSLRSASRVSFLLTRYAWERLSASRGTTLYLGNALAARLLQSVLTLGVDLVLGTETEDLVQDRGRIVGARLRENGSTLPVGARRGVVLATGGFSHNGQMRSRYLPASVAALSPVASGAAGDGIALAQDCGGVFEEGLEANAFWVPGSIFSRRDGTKSIFPHTVTDRAKPGVIAVDRSGRRFLNEAVSYHEFVRRVLRCDRERPCIPAYLVCDRDFIWRYGLGAIKPFTLSLTGPLKRGDLYRGETLAALARQLRIDPAGLAETVHRYNEHARRGEDPQFGKGADPYQRYMGDADAPVGPCNAPIERPPFYAVAIRPTDLGTAAGLATDADGRVAAAGAAPVSGLFACGNDMRSIMNGSYPGPGITLGPAIVFGYLVGLAAVSESPADTC